MTAASPDYLTCSMSDNFTETRTVELKTVCECNELLNNKTLHPQIAIIDLNDTCVIGKYLKLGLYTVILVEKPGKSCSCGCKYYDFSFAVMLFLAPGAKFMWNSMETLPGKGTMLLFHPDFLRNTSLGHDMGNYSFFLYDREEALHLSERETFVAKTCLASIGEELHHAIDGHSEVILSRQIELLLDYCARFYERQFIMRTDCDGNLTGKMKLLLQNALQSAKFTGCLPVPAYFASALGMSEAYFRDLLKFETGKTFEEFCNAVLML